MLLKPQVLMPSSHTCLKFTFQVFVKCIISSREYISACTCHYLPQCTFCTCKSINQSNQSQVVDSPTHGSYFIDLVLASDPCLVYDLAVVEPFPALITVQYTSQSFVLLLLSPIVVLAFDTSDMQTTLLVYLIYLM